ncbi:MAG: MBL fold metallo-hydrolase [Oscillospiraceae bacterium]|nr:MBL fold metallo-hydrolase [Oscillospiraceae bacterium]
MANYISLYSGSSGNCSVIEQNGKFILIDIGKSARITTNAIKDIGLDIKNLQGVLVSHEHSDHVSGLRVFLKKLDVPVYSNCATLDYLADYDLVPAHIRLEDMNFAGHNIGDFFVTGFDTPHDSVGCMGFNIHTQNGTRMTMATDLGCVTDSILSQFMGADLAVIESNYDEIMLRENENYPYYLKTRISSNRGHLSNRQCSDAAVKLIQSGVKKLHLCHLSNNNNTPSTALSQLAVTAMANGIDITKDLEVARANRRHEITAVTEF